MNIEKIKHEKGLPDNLTDKEVLAILQVEDRKTVIDRMIKKGSPFVKLTSIEFKRVIFEISGELINLDTSKKYGMRFVSKDRLNMFYPAHFDLDGSKFTLSLNVMCSKGESPILSGNYYLVLFEKYKNHRQEMSFVPDATHEIVRRNENLFKITYDTNGNVLQKEFLTREYPCIIDDTIGGMCNADNSNPWNFKIKRGDKNLFYAESRMDMDTVEYYLAVTYKPPGEPYSVFNRHKKNLQKLKTMKSNMVKDLNDLKLWGFKKLNRVFSKFAKRNGDIILFCSGSRAEIGGNEKFIYDRMVERGLDKQFKFRFDFKESITTKRSIWKMLKFDYYLATSDIILLDDYYPEIYKVDYDKSVKVLQVWHACGAFKSLGFERLGKAGAPAFNTRVHKCYTHVPVSSYHSARHHAEGFAIDESKFYPVGIPRTDIFFDEKYKEETRAKMFEVFPACKNSKTVYLYAPTFRGSNATDATFPFDKIDLEKWGELLVKEDATLIVKLHPFVTKRIEIPEKYKDRIFDATDYREVNDILFIVDVLITDYSSIIYEMSLLKKPMVFYAFDQKYYEATRDFYEPYEDLVPGKIVHDFDELMDSLENKDFQFEKMNGFIEKNFTYTDGKSTDRVIDQLILGKSPKNNVD